MHAMNDSNSGAESEWVKLIVGGKKFETTRSVSITCTVIFMQVCANFARTTLCLRDPDSMLARWFAPSDMSSDSGVRWPSTITDDDGYIRVDRSGRYFDIVLNYLRHGKLVIDRGLSIDGELEH